MAIQITPTSSEFVRLTNYKKLKAQILAFSDDANGVWDALPGGTKGAAKTAFESIANWNGESTDTPADHLFVLCTALLITMAGLISEVNGD